MRFPYQQIEEDSIESHGNVQASVGSVNGDVTQDDDEEDSGPPRPILPYWPTVSGICQIVIGLLCASFGAAEIFLLDDSIAYERGWQLSWINSYGLPVYSGLVLIISGSLAVRASFQRNPNTVCMFYMVTLLSFLLNLAFMIWILACKIVNQNKDLISNKNISMFSDARLALTMLSTVWCLLGCFLLFSTTVNYFCPVMFGEIKLLRSLGVCFIPCKFYKPPKRLPCTDLVNDGELTYNLVV